jgi:hypothetical protein
MKKLSALAVMLLSSSLVTAQVVVGGQGVTIIFPAAGAPSGNCSGLNYFYVNTSNGNLYTCPNPASSWSLVSGGSGSGTVSANNTAAGAVANYAAAGGSTTVQATTLNYVAPTLTVSTAAGGNGVLALSGNTSGTASFTAPAVAGTTTNAVTMSNVLSGPNGTAGAAVYATGGVGSGLYAAGSSEPAMTAASTTLMAWVTGAPGNAVIIPRNVSIGFGANVSSNLDSAFSSQAVGTMQLGNGTLNDESGLLRQGQCRITGAITLSTAATTICSWQLQAIAKTWAWQCSGTYNITAGTAPEFAIGLNASQTPTSETGNAAIYSTGSANGSPSVAAVFATGSNTFTTSGNNVLFTPTAAITTVTNAPWTSSGTIQASAAQGTFAITGILTGTTPAGTVSVGSTCQLY